MALLSILKYPDPRLHTIAEPVFEVNQQIRHLVNDMAETFTRG
jgi:peptide deformylase